MWKCKIVCASGDNDAVLSATAKLFAKVGGANTSTKVTRLIGFVESQMRVIEALSGAKKGGW